MKNIWIILAVSVVLFSGCKKEEEKDNTEQFTNKITLGTGMSGFTLTGEATSFYLIGGNLNIYWRLESQDDMAGSAVNILIERSNSGVFSPIDTLNFPNPQSYGHIMLSSFLHNYGSGNYKATGILVTGNKTIASKEFTVN